MPSRIIKALALGSATVLLLAGAGPAAAEDFAPLDRPGPALSVPRDKLEVSLHCTPGVAGAKVEPVLLNPGTGSETAAGNFSWNWMPALDKLGIPWCGYDPPYAAMGDMQISGEYLVHAIRTMHALAGRKIAIFGDSQGGTSMRWALRFWPDTRADVADVIGLVPANHGSTRLTEQNCARGCTGLGWQAIAGSPFMRALNSNAETFAGIAYTNVYSHTDELVAPTSGPDACSGCLHTGDGQITNVALQDICPADPSEHLATTIDNLAYLLTLDALRHDGPADPRRLPTDPCAQPFMPGVDANHVPDMLSAIEHGSAYLGVATMVAGVGVPEPFSGGAPVTTTAPPEACYTTASCPASDRLLIRAKRASRTLRVTVVVRIDGITSAVRGATIRIGKRSYTTGADGSAVAPAPKRRAVAIAAGAPGFLPGHATVSN